MKDFSGVFTALVTPFKDGEIDWVSLERLIRAQLERGIDGFVVCGTTGESPTLSDAEKEKLFGFVKSKTGGQVPLVMGTGSNSTSDTVEATRAAAGWGADAALVVVPYYNKPSQRGLFQHYQRVAECSELPVILYNVPGRTITKLELDTIVELSRLPKVIGIKEATGDIGFGKQIVDACGKDFLVTSGDDGTFIDLMGVGGRGVISVASHIMPKEFVSWSRKAMSGDKSVRNEFDRIRDLNNYLYVEANPIPVKMALHLMGLIDSPELRLPLTKLAEPYVAELRNKMTTAGLL
jgi:4-hydroxy-tetrahydrodipicolinate synthase